MTDLARRQPDPFAPPAARARRIEQVKIAFPFPAAVEYRWRFADGTRSSWSSDGNAAWLKAPPGASGIDWREQIPVRVKVPRARKAPPARANHRQNGPKLVD